MLREVERPRKVRKQHESALSGNEAFLPAEKARCVTQKGQK